jgi:hypothetical protein
MQQPAATTRSQANNQPTPCLGVIIVYGDRLVKRVMIRMTARTAKQTVRFETDCARIDVLT